MRRGRDIAQFEPVGDQYNLSMLAKVERKLARLAPDSPIRCALSPDMKDIGKRLRSHSTAYIMRTLQPPLFLCVKNWSARQIRQFEADVQLVAQNSAEGAMATCFLHQLREDRKWRGGLFEVFVKSRLLRRPRMRAVLDSKLPNRKEPDAEIRLGHKSCRIECMVLTESEEDRKRLERFLSAQQAEPGIFTLVQPGRFDTPGYASLGFDTRLYRAVFDKLAPRMDPQKSQMSDSCPNVLLISFYAPGTLLSAQESSISSALDVLFDLNAPQQLCEFLETRARDDRIKLAEQEYLQRHSELLLMRKRISAVMLFDLCTLRLSRVNYNATPIHRISHREIAEIEAILATPPSWQL